MSIVMYISLYIHIRECQPVSFLLPFHQQQLFLGTFTRPYDNKHLVVSRTAHGYSRSFANSHCSAVSPTLHDNPTS